MTARLSASHMTDDALDALYAERDLLAAAVAAVCELHQPAQLGIRGTLCAHCSGWDGFRCRGVVTPWPCPTAQAASPANTSEEPTR